MDPKGQCIQSGQLFIKESDKWRIADRRLPEKLPKKLEFFYAVDGTRTCAANLGRVCTAGFGILFVGVQQTDSHRGDPSVALSVNDSLPFEEGREAKQQYQDTILKKRPVPSDNTKRWLSLRSLQLGTDSLLNLLTNEVLSELDYPVGISSPDRRLHSRLYRYERGSISCIPFYLKPSSNLVRLIVTLLDVSVEKDEVATPEMVRSR